LPITPSPLGPLLVRKLLIFSSLRSFMDKQNKPLTVVAYSSLRIALKSWT
jgi:hypothetical protein